MVMQGSSTQQKLRQCVSSFSLHKLDLFFDPHIKLIGPMVDVTLPISSCIFYHLLPLLHHCLSISNKSQPRRHRYVYKEGSNIANSWL